MQVTVKRKNIKFQPDASRVIARFLYTGDERALSTIRLIVEHSVQLETGPDEKRVIISFRTTGEGHMFSIVFRTGMLDKNGSMIHNDDLIIPYAIYEYASTYATVNLHELVNELKNSF